MGNFYIVLHWTTYPPCTSNLRFFFSSKVCTEAPWCTFRMKCYLSTPDGCFNSNRKSADLDRYRDSQIYNLFTHLATKRLRHTFSFPPQSETQKSDCIIFQAYLDDLCSCRVTIHSHQIFTYFIARKNAEKIYETKQNEPSALAQPVQCFTVYTLTPPYSLRWLGSCIDWHVHKASEWLAPNILHRTNYLVN